MCGKPMAFRLGHFMSPRLRLGVSERRSILNQIILVAGKAEPFRTSSGEAQITTLPEILLTSNTLPQTNQRRTKSVENVSDRIFRTMPLRDQTIASQRHAFHPILRPMTADPCRRLSPRHFRAARQTRS